MANNMFLSSQETEAFSKALKMMTESLENLNEVFYQLQPAVLYQHGLKKTFTDLSQFIKQEYLLSVDFFYEGADSRINESYEIALYKIGLELIINAIRHAKATHLSLLLVQHESRITLTVSDNGQGFDESTQKIGEENGLNQIRRQLKNYKGWIAITSNLGAGTEVIVELNW